MMGLLCVVSLLVEQRLNHIHKLPRQKLNRLVADLQHLLNHLQSVAFAGPMLFDRGLNLLVIGFQELVQRHRQHDEIVEPTRDKNIGIP
jgi:hypothetical protein